VAGLGKGVGPFERIVRRGQLKKCVNDLEFGGLNMVHIQPDYLHFEEIGRILMIKARDSRDQDAMWQATQPANHEPSGVAADGGLDVPNPRIFFEFRSG
jgi:hypothetical protein